MVIAMTPVLDHLAHLAHAFKDIAVEHFGTHGSVEAFDKRVLRRLAGLDEAQLDRVFLRPIRKRLTDQLRSIVESQPFGFAAKRYTLFLQCRCGYAYADYEISVLGSEVDIAPAARAGSCVRTRTYGLRR